MSGSISMSRLMIHPQSAQPKERSRRERWRRAIPAGYQKHAFEQALDEGYFERVGFTPSPSLMAKDWAS